MKLNTFAYIFIVNVVGISAAENSNLTGLEKAGKEQQKTIGHIVSSLKEVKKIIKLGSEEQEKRENPFKGNKKYVFEKFDEKSNPEFQLKQLLEKQNKIIKNKLSRESKIEKQQQITDKLAQMSTNNNIDEDTLSSIKKAYSFSYQTQKALESKDDGNAKLGAGKTASEIQSALNKLNTSSGKSMKSSMNSVQKNFNKAYKETQKKNYKNAASELNKAFDKIQKESSKQYKSGKMSLANDLSKTLKKMQKEKTVEKLKQLSENDNPDDRKKVSDAIEKFQKEISKLKNTENENKLQNLKNGIDKMKRLKQRLEFYQNKNNPDDKKDVVEDAETILFDNKNLIEEIKPEMNVLFALNLINNQRGKKAAYNVQTKSFGSDDKIASLIVTTENMTLLSEQILRQLNEKRLTHSFNKDDVPEKYINEVADYFKRLSEKEMTDE